MKKGIILGFLAVAMAACSGSGPLGSDGPIIARTGAVNQEGAVFNGTWQRRTFFLDDFGFANSSETTWQFLTDGSVVRTQITRNLTLGLADVVLSTGRWRVSGTRLIIDFQLPAPSRLEFEARVVSGQLELGGEVYLRVGL
ncbi:MAG: hypothetical protein ACT4OZ_16670 [Gemmatimonadota bacterium]